MANKYVLIIGGANVDIIGRPYGKLKQNDSNPGFTTMSLGGVARNIAENLARLDVTTEFITVLGNDSHAREIIGSCQDLGIGLSHSLFLEEGRTSTYLCINDDQGDMQIAISDMHIYENISVAYLREKLDIINGAELLIVDTNITEEAIGFLMESCQVPVFLDTVSTKKTEKIKPFMKNIHTLKPNVIEAEILSGIAIETDKDLEKATDLILQKGIKRLFVTLGERGVYFNDGIKKGLIGSIPAEVVSTTGAGDSFVAGAVYSFLRGMDIEESAKLGQAASNICIRSPLTVSKDMSADNINFLVENNWR